MIHRIEDFIDLAPGVVEELERHGFGTVESIASASVSELVSRRYGITKAMARELKSAAHKIVDVDFKIGDNLSRPNIGLVEVRFKLCRDFSKESLCQACRCGNSYCMKTE